MVKYNCLFCLLKGKMKVVELQLLFGDCTNYAFFLFSKDSKFEAKQNILKKMKFGRRVYLQKFLV